MGLIALLLFLASVSLALEVAVGFGKLTPDRDIINLLEKCNAKIRAMWYASPYGGGGSGAEREWHEPRNSFQESRKRLLEGYRIGYFEDVAKFKIILENTLLEVEDLAKHPRLLKFVRGLVNNYYQEKESYFYIKDKGPIVYAVLVRTDDVDCLENDKLVKDISVNYFPLFTAFLKYVPYYFRPKRYGQYYFFPEVKNAKPGELYRMIEEAVREHENNKEFIQHYEKFYIRTEFYKKKLNFLKRLIEKYKHGNAPMPTYYPNDGEIFSPEPMWWNMI